MAVAIRLIVKLVRYPRGRQILLLNQIGASSQRPDGLRQGQRRATQHGDAVIHRR